jgi:hypothetical protein
MLIDIVMSCHVLKLSFRNSDKLAVWQLEFFRKIGDSCLLSALLIIDNNLAIKSIAEIFPTNSRTTLAEKDQPVGCCIHFTATLHSYMIFLPIVL